MTVFLLYVQWVAGLGANPQELLQGAFSTEAGPRSGGANSAVSPIRGAGNNACVTSRQEAKPNSFCMVFIVLQVFPNDLIIILGEPPHLLEFIVASLFHIGSYGKVIANTSIMNYLPKTNSLLNN